MPPPPFVPARQQQGEQQQQQQQSALHPHLQLQQPPPSAPPAAPAMLPPLLDTIHPPMLPTRPPPKKRNRAALSCTSCRERKIKCSRQVPCDQCIKRGDEAYCRMAPHPKDKDKPASQTTTKTHRTPARSASASASASASSSSASTSTPSITSAGHQPGAALFPHTRWFDPPTTSATAIDPYAFPSMPPPPAPPAPPAPVALSISPPAPLAATQPPRSAYPHQAQAAAPAPPAANPAELEFQAIKARLAQLEASLAHAQMQAAHNAAAAAAAGVSVQTLPPPPPASSADPPAPAPAPAPATAPPSIYTNMQQQQQHPQQQQWWPLQPNSSTRFEGEMPPPSIYRRQQQQPQQQQQQKQNETGESVDSDTEDAAAVLEGLAMRGKKDGDDPSAFQKKTGIMLVGADPAASAGNHNSNGTAPGSAASAANGDTNGVLSHSHGSKRNAAFRSFLEADKRRDLMLPDGSEAQSDANRDRPVRERAIAEETFNETAELDDEGEQDDEENDDDDDDDDHDEDDAEVELVDASLNARPADSDAMDIDSTRAGDSSTTSSNKKSPASSAAAKKPANKKNKKPSAVSRATERIFERSSMVLSAAYKDAAQTAKDQVDASRRRSSAATTTTTTTPAAGTASASSVASSGITPHSNGSTPTPAPSLSTLACGAGGDDGSSPSYGSGRQGSANKTIDADPASGGSASPNADAPTHIRGPTADSYDIARSHQGLFRVIVQGESMLGFGLGWPFAAAEEVGDYKVIKGIGACPGNTQREAVLRAIIRTVPERETVDQILNVWEENVSFLAGKVIHVPTLRKEIETFFAFDSVEKRARVVSYVDPGWLAVLLMVFVTAMQFWPCSSSKVPSIFDGRSQSVWYAAAKSALVLARYQSSQSLSVLQSIILINLHAQEPGRVNTALMRIAINNAMDLRLHRLGDVDKSLTANGSCPGPCQFVRRQIELRIWWALVFRDWTSSACTGSYIIRDDWFNTPLPANLNEYELCQTPSPQSHPIQTATEMSYVLANIEFAKAVRLNTDLLNRVSIQSAGKSKSLRAEDTQVLDQVYRSVLSNAPSFFQAGSREGEGTNLEVQRWLFVQAVFHKLLHLHRPRISSRTDSRVTCVLLARSILDMQGKLRGRCTVVSKLCLNQLQSFSAASLLCLDLLQSPPRGAEGSDPALREAIRSEVNEALEALRTVAEENHTAQRMYRIIEALLAEEEHRWNTAGPSAANANANASGVLSGQQQQQQQAPNFHAGQKRKRSEISGPGGVEQQQQQMTTQQRKRELLRLAQRVAEAAQEQTPREDGSGCPLAEHAARRQKETQEANANADAAAAAERSQAQAQVQTQQSQNQSQHVQAQAPVHGFLDGMSAPTSVATMSLPELGNAMQQDLLAMQAQTAQQQQQQQRPSGPMVIDGALPFTTPEARQARMAAPIFSGNPFIFPTPSLAEHPMFTDKEFATNILPTQPTFSTQQYALAPNGLDLRAAPASPPDGFGFDLNSFMALMNSQSPASTASGSGSGNARSTSGASGAGAGAATDPAGIAAAAEAAAAAAAQWFNPAQGNNGSGSASSSTTDLFNFSGGNAGSSSALVPSPAASASSNKQQTQQNPSLAAFSQQALPTPPQSDSAGSSSGQSPPASSGSGAGADASNDWFWNWVLGQGAVSHSRTMPEALQNVPALSQVAEARAAAAAGGAGQGSYSLPSAPVPQQQQQEDPTSSMLSSGFLPVPPVSSGAENSNSNSSTGNVTSQQQQQPLPTPSRGMIRHMPGTPSSYFSQHFFAPTPHQHDHHHHQQQQQQSAPLGAVSLGTPSANLGVGSSSSSSGGGGPMSSSAFNGTGSSNGPTPVSSGATTNNNDNDSSAVSAAGALPEMSMQDFGTWLQAPSLFDYAGNLGIAEGGQNISPDAGYLGALMLA
ncbi:hypothetical protein OC834_002889 [Tilletia horrida]|nr:hypothetical protein OC834_002889 [Tilletia horrida]